MESNTIHVGDKIDIRVLQQVEQERTTGIVPRVYKSKLQDIKPDGMLEISVPISSGRAVLLSTGLRYEFIFYTRKGLYRCEVQVKEYYKTENIYIFLVEPKSPLEKFQRREYFRFECAMDMEYFDITEEEAKIEDIARLKQDHREENPDFVIQQGIAVDLSGGGIRFVGDREGKKGEFLLISIFLRSIDVNHQLEVAGRVLSCKKVEVQTGKMAGKKKYEYRVQFLTRDQKKRETIIKYIFEQERKNRQKG